MNKSLWQTRNGPIISTLGGLAMVIGFCLPLYVTSPPLAPGSSNPYPPLVNGWYLIGILHDYFLNSYLALEYVTPEVVLALVFAVAILSSSMLVLFRHSSLLVARMRLYAAFASIAVPGWLWTASLFLNWAGSPTVALGPAF